jgi:hypothetical protein
LRWSFPLTRSSVVAAGRNRRDVAAWPPPDTLHKQDTRRACGECEILAVESR